MAAVIASMLKKKGIRDLLGKKQGRRKLGKNSVRDSNTLIPHVTHIIINRFPQFPPKWVTEFN